MAVRLLTLVICLLGALLPFAGCSMPTHEQQSAANELYLKKEGITALEPGRTAPSLDGVTDSTGQAASLRVLLEQDPQGLIFYFFPALDAPNSLRNLRDWQQRSGKLAELGVGVVGIAPTSPELLAAWQQQHGLRLTLLADPQGQAARAWGCLGPEGRYPQRTTVGVDRQGGIVLFYRGVAPENIVKQHFAASASK